MEGDVEVECGAARSSRRAGEPPSELSSREPTFNSGASPGAARIWAQAACRKHALKG